MNESVADRFPAGAIHNGRVQDERGEADEFRACFDHLAAWAEEAKTALDAAHAEIARLTEARDGFRKVMYELQADLEAAEVEITASEQHRAAAEAQVAAMRAELERCEQGQYVEEVLANYRRVRREALAALPAEGKEPCEVCGDTGLVDGTVETGHGSVISPKPCPRPKCEPRTRVWINRKTNTWESDHG